MPREIIRVPNGSHGGGIVYLAVLAYPENMDRRKKFVESALAAHFKNGIWRGEIEKGQVPTRYRKMKNQTLESTLRLGLNRIQKWRLSSYHYAIAYIFKRWNTDHEWRQSAQDGRPGDKSSHRYVLRRKSRTHAMRRFTELTESDEIDDPDSPGWVRPMDDDLEETTNARPKVASKRYWKNSKPVLHLMFALPFGEPIKAINIGKNEPFYLPIGKGTKNFRPIHELLFDGLWVDEALDIAEVWQTAILPEFLSDYCESETIQLIPS